MVNIKTTSKLFKHMLGMILAISVIMIIILFLIILTGYKKPPSNSYNESVEFVTKYQDEIEQLSIWFSENKALLESETRESSGYKHEGDYYHNEKVTSRIEENFSDDIKSIYNQMQSDQKFYLRSAIKESYGENLTKTGEWEMRNPIVYSTTGLFVAYFYDTSQHEKYSSAVYPKKKGIDDLTYYALAETLRSYGEGIEHYTKINDNLYIAQTYFMGT